MLSYLILGIACCVAGAIVGAILMLLFQLASLREVLEQIRREVNN